MSFTLKVHRNEENQISALAEFKIWQKATFLDDSMEIKQIYPLVSPLLSTLTKMKAAKIILKKREDSYELYQLEYFNELGISVGHGGGGSYYFHFLPDIRDLPIFSDLKKVEYSTDHNFAQILTNQTFQFDYTFQKIIDTDYSFFIQAEDNSQYYKETLIPFAIDYPDNTKRIVKHTLTNIQLPIGFYQIDGISYFFDKNNEVLPSNYIIKVTI